ncbi:spore germination protein KA [Peribacillus deserti]|uniref:Spore germination protein KA n=1 Tax=Peribacillus deserti TaxID=673318 RepID=A0ABS2QEP4_9BACI|nr:spore germination protein [Peribacillus deserti]MBM7691465.1 spore germination protein KA [Peribacillus deserti]
MPFRMFRKENTGSNMEKLNGPANENIMTYNLPELKEVIKYEFANTADLKVVHIQVKAAEMALFYLESMVDIKSLKEMTAKMMEDSSETSTKLEDSSDLKLFFSNSFGLTKIESMQSKDNLIQALVRGSLVIAAEGIDIMSLPLPNTEKRSIEEPTSERVIRGPKDGFTESLATNVSLIRRRILNPKLCFEEFTLGENTGTLTYIGYINGLANEDIVKEVKDRIKRIKTDSVLGSGNIEELIADKTATLFPLALNTERPDRVAAKLLEGKIVIIVDGTPFSLLVPAVFNDFFQAAEDYYQPYFMASFLRFIRYLCFMIGLLIPSFYVAAITYHHELIPTQFLLALISQRDGIPFPAMVEVLIMEVTFEILREAAIRTPKHIGQMVSIVGALVIGQAAAESGIISNVMIIIVSITAITNFVSPIYTFGAASRLLRFLLIFAASILGLYGILLVMILIVAHLCSLRSFGIPYLSPVAPFILEDQNDVFFRFPFWAKKNNPLYLYTNEEMQAASPDSPSPPTMTQGREKQ